MDPLDFEDVRGRVQKALTTFVEAQRPRLGVVAPDLAAVSDEAAAFLLDGGKRLRPAFCYWGWRGADGTGVGPDGDAAVTAAASLELVHACALVHDDVMDASDTRRGRPSAHRLFAARHRDAGWRGDPDAFGIAAAILLGDLCLIWSDELFGGCGLPATDVDRARPVFQEMRVEVMAGQYLDLVEQARGDACVERALRVARYKAAKYTIERPLHVGALLADAPPELVAAYSAYGLPLGEAFQLRDDLLGVFGDPARTGKPAGDDLREGKRTVLVATALARSTAAQHDVVDRLLGDPALDSDGVATLRTVIEETGARAEAERLIGRLADQAREALTAARVSDEARTVLTALASATTVRAA